MLELAEILLSNWLKLCECTSVLKKKKNQHGSLKRVVDFACFLSLRDFFFFLNIQSYLVHYVITFQDVD